MGEETRNWGIVQFHSGEEDFLTDEIAVEYPLTVVVNGREFATMVCSPNDLEYLVIGFLASEGVIRGRQEIESLSIDEETGFAYTELTKEWTVTTSHDKRWIGSCCGKSRAFYFESDAKTARTVMNQLKIAPEECTRLMSAFQKSAHTFKRTGGVHQAALATTDNLQIAFSDIGRHNALDKLFGYMIQHRVSKSDHLILFSGRISSEVLLKVSKMGIGLLLSKSAPTDLALQLAMDLNITAVGFVREERMNVYTHPERLMRSGERALPVSEKGGIDADGT
ncbi:formate dehydrogenase accessory sulfurtransferase FdhD [Halobacillus litoralis]|uniref:formate dehydrogenase accessory sulfurtransferase FdhD n=1 Tax=Halobacillus litoralis TaxID=45668 RepID=UPI001CD724C3|nr:formate dehydrogenase accessory sulfurtransferase FdhD [Halobacillus litoralis]MCA0969514.1 formate dehydrogenase accessory sulfurtransferase FdhD [Halobacillus litoralis]